MEQITDFRELRRDVKVIDEQMTIERFHIIINSAIIRYECVTICNYAQP
jgi:hypothetical protein